MKPIEIKSNSYAEYNVDFNEKDPKFQVGDHVRISKCKNIFAKGYTPNWSEILIMILVVKKLLELFMKNNWRRLIKKNLE